MAAVVFRELADEIAAHLSLADLATALHLDKTFWRAARARLQTLWPRLQPLFGPPFHIRGLLQPITLDLTYKQVGDAGMQAFSTAVSNGALPQLENLNLSNNQMGDAGLAALASACGSGAMAKLTKLNLENNPGNDEHVQKILRDRRA